MCYSRDCPYENYWGECEKPKRKACPKEEEREEETNDRESEED